MLLSYRGCELAAVNEFQLLRLCRHRSRDFRHAVSDKIHRGRSREVEILLAASIPEINSFTADSGGKRLAERAPQKRGIRRRTDGGGFRHASDYAAIYIQVSKLTTDLRTLGRRVSVLELS